jgi:hypothetical protein
MASIDANDDTKRRWIVHHFRYVPERRQHRTVVVAGFNNRREWRRFIDQARSQLQERKDAGTADSREQISGSERQAGYDRVWRDVREHRPISTTLTRWGNLVPGLPQPLTRESSSAFVRARRRLSRRWLGRFRSY